MAGKSYTDVGPVASMVSASRPDGTPAAAIGTGLQFQCSHCTAQHVVLELDLGKTLPGKVKTGGFQNGALAGVIGAGGFNEHIISAIGSTGRPGPGRRSASRPLRPVNVIGSALQPVAGTAFKTLAVGKRGDGGRTYRPASPAGTGC